MTLKEKIAAQNAAKAARVAELIAAKAAREAAAPPIDHAAIRRDQEAAILAREAYANRDMTAENALADIAKAESAMELARILALAGVSTHNELMGSVPWAAQYLPYEKGGDLVVFDNTGETRGVWDHATKAWVWVYQNNRGNRDDRGSGYGRHSDD